MSQILEDREKLKKNLAVRAEIEEARQRSIEAQNRLRREVQTLEEDEQKTRRELRGYTREEKKEIREAKELTDPKSRLNPPKLGGRRTDRDLVEETKPKSKLNGERDKSAIHTSEASVQPQAISASKTESVGVTLELRPPEAIDIVVESTKKVDNVFFSTTPAVDLSTFNEPNQTSDELAQVFVHTPAELQSFETPHTSEPIKAMQTSAVEIIVSAEPAQTHLELPQESTEQEQISAEIVLSSAKSAQTADMEVAPAVMADAEDIDREIANIRARVKSLLSDDMLPKDLFPTEGEV